LSARLKLEVLPYSTITVKIIEFEPTGSAAFGQSQQRVRGSGNTPALGEKLHPENKTHKKLTV
jgi:hypothetical protein